MRTSLILNEETRKAVRQLAQHYDCSASEAIRRAVLRQRDAVRGVSAEFRRQRSQAFRRLIRLFEGSDPETEIKRLKGEDEGF